MVLVMARVVVVVVVPMVVVVVLLVVAVVQKLLWVRDRFRDQQWAWLWAAR